MATLLDLHCHTSRHSICSVLNPLDAVRRAVAAGFGGVAITEHEYLWEPDALAQLRRQARVPEGFVVLGGQEVETDVGHVLVFGATGSLPDPWPLEILRRQQPQAALVWAHPFRYRRIPSDEALCNPLLDAVEVLNYNQTAAENQAALDAYHRLGFVGVAGSDSHSLANAARFPTVVDGPVANEADLVAHLRAGRCRPFLPTAAAP